MIKPGRDPIVWRHRRQLRWALVPPNDDDHGCAWRTYAQHLESSLAEVKVRLAALERQSFGRKSEKTKTGKMPSAVPPKTDPTGRKARTERAELRNAKLETEVTPVPVHDAERVCAVCSNRQPDRVGDGKPSTVYEYVPGYFRRRIVLRETLACSCGGHIVTAPAPDRVGDKTQYAPSFVAHLIVSKCADSNPQYSAGQNDLVCPRVKSYFRDPILTRLREEFPA